MIAASQVPDAADGNMPIDRIPREVEADLADVTLDLIEAFLNRTKV